jgi:hypothetical protein
MKKWFEKNSILLVLSLIFLFIGTKAWKYFSRNEIAIGFYHWKKELNLSAEEEDVLQKNKKTPLYIHFFDTDWDEDKNFVVPIAITKPEKLLPENTLICPVIFMTNRVFENTKEDNIEVIAEKIWERIAFLNEKYESEMGTQLHSVQIDCDWTLSTKDKYFAFLKALGDLSPVALSATIRLHQIKFQEKTGVPPVDRGMLMFYNMGDLDNPNTQNSILDLETAKQYVEYCKKYTLPLDIALPLFQWAVVLRDGKVVQLLNAANTQDFKDEDYFEKIGDLQYKVKESTYVHGYYCYEGDVIRVENVSQEQLEAAATMLSDYLPNERRTLCFYHLDYTILQANPYENLDKIRKKLE